MTQNEQSPEPPMNNVILCATQRCGSTLFVEDMRNTGVMGRPEEWLLPWDPAKEVNWKDAFGAVRKRATGQNGVMSIKVMANQLANADACLASFIEPKGSGTFPHFAAAFEGYTWVKLTRRDTVAQAISRVMSRQTGINHATATPEDDHFAGNLQKGYKSDYNKQTVYRYNPILRDLTSIVLENLTWDRFFETNGITPTEFVYEDVARDPEMTHLDTVAQIAGLKGGFARTERKLVKLANEKNQQWRTQFLEDAVKWNFRPEKPQRALAQEQEKPQETPGASS
ncbi:Stf0 family sulfotransferase [Marimonas lutisalis]|uniref:Stf0 family sulfotransferase n=1 Tax=Marimonas lutisalis TaxID=2545756 RepID=UPI0010F5F4D9|nr:Stf0 family sulfotransferase [Marimonas lutisalis]